MKRHCAWLIVFTLGATVALAGGAISGSTAADTSAAETSAAELANLIEQLDAAEFAQRQQASRKLSEAGKAVFPQVEKAAETGSREVATRAIEILRQHFKGGDLETKESAKASLERLAKSGNPAAAQRAEGVLNPPAAATLPPQAFGGMNPAILQQLQQLQQRQIQLGGVVPGQNVVFRTSVRTVNGIREIEVRSGDKITKVKDIAGGGLEASITEIHPNGKETTRKIEAKDLDDLKKKDADAAQIYETYSRRGGGIQIGGLAPGALPPGVLPPGFMPGGAFPGGAVPALPARPPESVKLLIESIDRSIERYKARLPNDPSAQRRLDSLEQLKKRYQEMLPKEEAKPAEGAAGAPQAAPADRSAAQVAAVERAREAIQAGEAARRAAEAAARAAEEAARKALEARDPFAP
jgi:hypothetical protein